MRSQSLFSKGAENSYFGVVLVGFVFLKIHFDSIGKHAAYSFLASNHSKKNLKTKKWEVWKENILVYCLRVTNVRVLPRIETI